MSDMMMFPKTVDEFMEKYKIVDSDEVYTNGAELVPIFRMKQWFDHVDAVEVVRCKDCRFYRFYDGTFGKGWMCFENNTARHGDDFCSRGERKDDE